MFPIPSVMSCWNAWSFILKSSNWSLRSPSSFSFYFAISKKLFIIWSYIISGTVFWLLNAMKLILARTRMILYLSKVVNLIEWSSWGVRAMFCQMISLSRNLIFFMSDLFVSSIYLFSSFLYFYICILSITGYADPFMPFTVFIASIKISKKSFMSWSSGMTRSTSRCFSWRVMHCQE